MGMPTASSLTSTSAAPRPLRRLFIDHPASVGETYGEHLLTASGFAGRMLLGGCACLIHAFLPFLFVRTGSRCISELHERMLVNRRRVR